VVRAGFLKCLIMLALGFQALRIIPSQVGFFQEVIHNPDRLLSRWPELGGIAGWESILTITAAVTPQSEGVLFLASDPAPNDVGRAYFQAGYALLPRPIMSGSLPDGEAEAAVKGEVDGVPTASETVLLYRLSDRQADRLREHYASAILVYAYDTSPHGDVQSIHAVANIRDQQPFINRVSPTREISVHNVFSDHVSYDTITGSIVGEGFKYGDMVLIDGQSLVHSTFINDALLTFKMALTNLRSQNSFVLGVLRLGAMETSLPRDVSLIDKN
jgi:hypothetical protein